MKIDQVVAKSNRGLNNEQKEMTNCLHGVTADGTDG